MNSGVLILGGAAVVVVGADKLLRMRQIRHEKERMRAADGKVQMMLADGINNPILAERLQAVQEQMPNGVEPHIWVLMVHVGEISLGSALSGKHMKLQVKYGERGHSLMRETGIVRASGKNSKGQAEASGPWQSSGNFNSTCTFMWQSPRERTMTKDNERGLRPLLRFRLRKCEHLERTVGQSTQVINFSEELAASEQISIHLVSTKTGSPQSIGKATVTVELRPVLLSELSNHGLNVGQVVPQAGLRDAALPVGQPVLMQGMPIQRAQGAPELNEDIRIREELLLRQDQGIPVLGVVEQEAALDTDDESQQSETESGSSEDSSADRHGCMNWCR